jgi:hypothetical protein
MNFRGTTRLGKPRRRWAGPAPARLHPAGFGSAQQDNARFTMIFAAGHHSAWRGRLSLRSASHDIARQHKVYDFSWSDLSSMNLRGVNRVGGELRTTGIARFTSFSALFSVVEHTPRNNGMAGHRATRLDRAGRLHASQDKARFMIYQAALATVQPRIAWRGLASPDMTTHGPAAQDKARFYDLPGDTRPDPT